MDKQKYFVFTKDKEGYAECVIVKWFFDPLAASFYADERNEFFGREWFFVGVDHSPS